MDSSRSLPHPLAATNLTRYLPTYEEANLPYSYRLPTYRSSYIRRYHPYARYTASPPPEYVMDGGDHIDEGTPLDDHRLDVFAGPAGEKW